MAYDHERERGRERGAEREGQRGRGAIGEAIERGGIGEAISGGIRCDFERQMAYDP